jgi:hypothetical protein
MGLYDYLRCEYPLPEGAPVDGYQTKDTPAQFLERYTITADGRLMERRVELEWIDDPGRGLIGGYFAAVPGTGEWVEIPLHGDLWFYDGEWEFRARFTEGRIARIEQVERDGGGL